MNAKLSALGPSTCLTLIGPPRPVKHAFGVVLVMLGAGEVGQHFGVGPALASGIGPVVIIGGVATEIDHPVDRAAAADHPPTRHRDRAARHARLRDGGEIPVRFLAPDCGGDKAGDMDERMAVMPARFEHADRTARVFPQPRGHGGPRRTGADNDEIECCCAHCALLSLTSVRVRASCAVGKGASKRLGVRRVAGVAEW